MNLKILIILLLPILLAFQPYPDASPPSGDESATVHSVPSFKDDIFPLMQEKCNSEDCHGGKESPTFDSYEPVRQKAKRIAKRIVDINIPMPPNNSGVRLDIQEIQLIQRWVKAGAPDN